MRLKVTATAALSLVSAAFLWSGVSLPALASPVPGYVPPVTRTTTGIYADDTRGVYVPAHEQWRSKTPRELQNHNALGKWGELPVYAQMNPPVDAYERNMNGIANGYGNTAQELDRIAMDPGMMAPDGQHLHRGNQNAYFPPAQGGATAPYQGGPQNAQPPAFQADMYGMQAGTGAYAPVPPYGNPVPPAFSPYGNGLGPDEGVEIAVGAVVPKTLDMVNSLVRLREDRITIRRALQRMMDQIGGGDWTVIWDLAEQNAGLPEMEISLYAEEPFINVMNALLARVQTRSGQPLRVIRYDKTNRMVITDRVGGHRLAGGSSSVGVDGSGLQPAVTEQVLKESMVSLHYDEIPLVDALESMVQQAGKGEWRLRVYAGLDQVLKPAHVEEPFSLGVERVLGLFNLKYEIFPGGKLVVVTHNNRFGIGR